MTQDQIKDRRRRFETAGRLVAPHLREAMQKRGFAEARLLTHWSEIAGADIAGLCQPVKISHGKGAMGATLVLQVTGAAGPLVQMRLPALRERLNAVYGYNAIARITLTQIALTGMAEAQADFAPPKPQISSQAARKAAAYAQGTQDDGLRVALERLARNVLSRTQIKKETT
jgi:hypothetical protein